MADTILDIACAPYDYVRPLLDGEVRIDGVDARFHLARIVPEIFEGRIRPRAYDVSELGMTYRLRSIEEGGQPFLALPVLPNRGFRHSAIFINRRSGIRSPPDLNGKRIGERALYGHDAGIRAKGPLSDECNFEPASCRWIIGRSDFPIKPIDFVRRPHLAGLEVIHAPDTDLGELLDAGAIDAFITVDIPGSSTKGSPNISRLFEDYVLVKRDIHGRAGIFLIMLTVVVTHTLAEHEHEHEHEHEQEQDMVMAIYLGFCEARDRTLRHLVAGMSFNNMSRRCHRLSPCSRATEKSREMPASLTDTQQMPRRSTRSCATTTSKASIPAAFRPRRSSCPTSSSSRLPRVFVDRPCRVGQPAGTRCSRTVVGGRPVPTASGRSASHFRPGKDGQPCHVRPLSQRFSRRSQDTRRLRPWRPLSELRPTAQ